MPTLLTPLLRTLRSRRSRLAVPTPEPRPSGDSPCRLASTPGLAVPTPIPCPQPQDSPCRLEGAPSTERLAMPTQTPPPLPRCPECGAPQLRECSTEPDCWHCDACGAAVPGGDVADAREAADRDAQNLARLRSLPDADFSQAMSVLLEIARESHPYGLAVRMEGSDCAVWSPKHGDRVASGLSERAAMTLAWVLCEE